MGAAAAAVEVSMGTAPVAVAVEGCNTGLGTLGAGIAAVEVSMGSASVVAAAVTPGGATAGEGVVEDAETSSPL